MNSIPPRNPLIWIALALLLAFAGPASAQQPAHADSVEIAVPLTFDGNGISAWGPIADSTDSASFRPTDPGMSLWEYPVAGLWWVIKLPFAILNYGFKAIVGWWGDIPLFNTVARLLSRLPEFGVRVQAEWTPASGLRYGVNVYENRPFDGRLHLQYWNVGGGRGDLVNMGSTRAFLGESTQLDFVASYHRRGAERYFGTGPAADRDDESYFTDRMIWYGGSVQQQLRSDLSIQGRVFYSDVQNRGPRKPDHFRSTEDVFAGDLPLGWGEASIGMNYEFEFKRDTTGTRGRGVHGGLQRLMVGYFHPTSGSAVDVMNYRVVLEQFIGGRSPSGRQLAVKAFWSWLDTGSDDVHFQRLLTNHDADAFRGFHDFRFRDRGILGLTLEYRYPVWDFGQIGGRLGMDGYVFWDTGQVFAGHSSIRMRDMTNSLGAGIRLVSAEDFMVRTEIAGSREDLIFRLSVSQIFQRSKGGVFHGRVPIPMR